MTEKKIVMDAIYKRTGTRIMAMQLQKISSDPRFRIYAVQLLNQTVLAKYDPNGEVTIKNIYWCRHYVGFFACYLYS